MSQRLSPLADRSFDLLVVGAGIFGAGVAREAALHGVRVALVERDDLGSATSCASSKLLHGGLRYLETFELSLVRQALRERHVQWEHAPHLAHPCPFLVPIWRDSPRGLWKLRAGLFLYDLLGRPERRFRRAMLSARDVLACEPVLEPDGLRGGGRYFDWQTFDSRLVSEVALSAAEHGAIVVTRAEVTAVSGGPPGGFRVSLRDRRDGGEAELRAAAIVATTGPWSDAFRLACGGDPRPRVRTTSGVHVVTRRIADHALVGNARRDGRVFFVLPFHGRSLIGTTDRDEARPADALPVEPADVDYLLEETNHMLRPEARLTRADVVQTTIGLRTLARHGDEHPSRTSREQVIFEDPPGIVQVLGGKLTTWRLIARELLERAAVVAGFALDDGTLSRTTRLPGGDVPRDRAQWPERARALAAAHDVPPDVVLRLLGTYGGRTPAVLELGRERHAWLEPVAGDLPELRAELVYLARTEHARTLVDVLRRRLPRLLVQRVGAESLRAAADVLGEELGWDAAERTRQVDEALHSQALPFAQDV